eukprot:TRINITY_DN1267_c0_g1_i3.p1 TRINITY_DN1267_c0_g1~~TRINITY_DN1267_c0_g1_i3.p1  ORF type:complete len:1085 (-),score=104.85 TRINITY_DN1267_c0_g1_i3:486-3740(-)
MASGRLRASGIPATRSSRSREQGGVPIGAPDNPGKALLTPRQPRGSGAPPRVPGGAAALKARKVRRRPSQRQRRHERQRAERDEAAAADSPFATLRCSAAAWAALGVSHWVLRTILYGLHIPWLTPPPPTRSKGYPMPAAELAWSLLEVQRWVDAGYVQRLTAAVGAGSLWVSPSFFVLGGKDRLVVDLRLINKFIAQRTFKYQRLSRFLSTLLPDEYVVSWDVRDAFYHVRIWPAHRKYFRYVVGGTVYEPTVLPFGMRISPWAWTKVMRPVVAALRRRGHTVMAYVDDFAATGCGARPSSSTSATTGREGVLDLFRALGVHVHPRKGEAIGTRRLVLLGFLVDTHRRLVLLPADRLAKVVGMAKMLLSAAAAHSRRVPTRALSRFTGTAVSTTLAVPSARHYLRRLYTAQGGRHSGTTTLPHGATQDLTWFSHLRQNDCVGRARRGNPTLGDLTTDASPWGWGPLGLLTAGGRLLYVGPAEHAHQRQGGLRRPLLPALLRGAVARPLRRPPRPRRQQSVNACDQRLLFSFGGAHGGATEAPRRGEDVRGVTTGGLAAVRGRRVGGHAVTHPRQRPLAGQPALLHPPLPAVRPPHRRPLRHPHQHHVPPLQLPLALPGDGGGGRLLDLVGGRRRKQLGEPAVFAGGASPAQDHRRDRHRDGHPPGVVRAGVMADSRRPRHRGVAPPPAGGPVLLGPTSNAGASTSLAGRCLPLRPRRPLGGSSPLLPHPPGTCRSAAAPPPRPLGARWRRRVGKALARATPGGGADGAAARFLRNWSVADATANRYDGHWRRFSVYCASRRVTALPASTSAVVEFIGSLWNANTVVAVTLKPILAAVRKHHLAAGYSNPCDAEPVREAKAGFRRAGLALRPQDTILRVALPSAVAWRLAMLSGYMPRTTRHLLTAVVAQFWRMRRAGDITRLRVKDVNLPADGRVCYQVKDHKTDAADGLLARTLPAAVDSAADVPRLLLVRLLADKRAAGCSPNARLFTRCTPDDASAVMKAWLRDGLQRLGVRAPVGTCYASHSLKKGGATSANAAGVPRGAISELAGTTEKTLAESYISALAVPSTYDRLFYGRLLPATP